MIDRADLISTLRAIVVGRLLILIVVALGAAACDPSDPPPPAPPAGSVAANPDPQDPDVGSQPQGDPVDRQENSVECSVQFVDGKGTPVPADRVLGRNDLIKLIHNEPTGRAGWFAAGDPQEGMRRSRTKNGMGITLPAGGGAVGFWVRFDERANHEMVQVISWTPREDSAALRGVVGSATVTGRVLTEDGKPLEGVCVALVPARGQEKEPSDGYCESWGATVTDSKGEFFFSNIFAGRYQVVPGGVYAFAGSPQSPSWGFPELPERPGKTGFLVRRVPGLPVAIADADITLEPFILERCGGRFVVDGSALGRSLELELARPVDPPFMFLPMLEGDAEWLSHDSFKVREKPEEGIATFENVPLGTYRLFAIFDGGVAVCHEITVTGETGYGEADLVLKPIPDESTGGIDGRCVDWEDLPLKNRIFNLLANRSAMKSGEFLWMVAVYVEVLPEDETEFPYCRAHVPVGEDGRFSVKGLLPGRYRVGGFVSLVPLPGTDGAADHDAERVKLEGELKTWKLEKLDIELQAGTTAEARVGLAR